MQIVENGYSHIVKMLGKASDKQTITSLNLKNTVQFH